MMEEDDELKLPEIKWYVPENPQALIVWCHGGQFVHGDHTWDGSFCTAMRAQGIGVIQTNFRQGPDHPFPEAICDLKVTFMRVKKVYPDVPMFVGGTSSGAFFAWRLANKLEELRWRLKGVILVAPVLDPFGRHHWLTRQGRAECAIVRNQMAYFRNLANMARLSGEPPLALRSRVLFVCGTNDRDAPLELVQPFIDAMGSRGTTVMLSRNHKALCTNIPVSSITSFIATTLAARHRGSSRVVRRVRPGPEAQVRQTGPAQIVMWLPPRGADPSAGGDADPAASPEEAPGA